MKHAADLQLWCWDGLVRCGLDWKSCGLSADWRCCRQCPSTAATPYSIVDCYAAPSSRVPLCFTGPGSKTFHHRHHRGNGLVGGTLVGTVAASVGLVYSCSSSTTCLSGAWSSATAGAVPCTSRIRSTVASVSTTPGRHGQGRFPEHTGHTRPGPLDRVPVGVWGDFPQEGQKVNR